MATTPSSRFSLNVSVGVDTRKNRPIERLRRMLLSDLVVKSTLLFVFALPSSAQTTTQTPTQTPNTSSPAKIPPVQQRIEVTATRVPEDPDEVPTAIQVISGEELSARGANDLRSTLSEAIGVDTAPGGDAGPASAVPEFWGLKEFDAFLLV